MNTCLFCEAKTLPFPRYVRIGGHVVQIKRVKGLIENDQVFGTWDDGQLTICLDADIDGSILWETLFHECVHGVCDLALPDWEIDHKVVQVMGLLFFQVVQSMFEEEQRA